MLLAGILFSLPTRAWKAKANSEPQNIEQGM
jgi:hypothetical protein